MRISCPAFWFVWLLLGVVSQGAQAQSAASATRLITQAIDENDRVVLAGNTRPEANAANDRGAIAAGTQLEHMHLQLQPGAAGEQAADAFVAAQYDPSSPLYQRWLTPDAYGARFGLGTADIDRVTGWLTSHGFTVNLVYPSRLVIDFSGTAGQVARAFHTEIHRFDVAGQSHIANVSDPQIPAALAPAVAGIVSLHDFRVQNKHVARPNYTGAASQLLTPSDLSTIYNFHQAFNAGYTGVGQVIAAVEDTDLYSDADWSTFRRVFEIYSYNKGKLVVSHPAPKGGAACGDPGVTADDQEATLDVEWASAGAPNAEILLASCAGTKTTDGVYLAIQNVVNAAAPPPIISVSYGTCETQDGQTENRAFFALYRQAAAEGISVYVATGDNGPSDCAADGQQGATLGIGANGWATTWYNVAVGGTDFGDTYAGTNATYWRAKNNGAWGSAISYIPEIPWNDTCASVLVAQFVGGTSVTYGANGFCNSANGQGLQTVAGGEGAPSGCAVGVPAKPGVVSGTCEPWPKPSWQYGLFGVPNDSRRDTPDVSLFASNGIWAHAYIICFSDPNNGGGPCTGDPGNWLGGGGGTSYATPIWAGIQALINQKAGKKQGFPAPELYKLAIADYGKAGNPGCNASLGNKIGVSCIFHNVTLGDDDIDCVKGSPNCYTPSGKIGVLSTSTTAYKPAYKAGVGWNFPTGIGSVNVYNLLANWPTAP